MMEKRKLSLLDESVTRRLVRKIVNPNVDGTLLSMLSLIDEKNNVTPVGEEILSAYPYFGEGGREREKYPSLVFAFALSAREIKSYKKDRIASFFPEENKEKIYRLFSLVHKAFVKEEIISDNGEINISSASSFISLTIPDRLSYITASLLVEDSSKIKKALSYLENVNAIERNQLLSVIHDLNGTLDIDLSLELLMDLFVFSEEDGLYTARILKKDEEDSSYTLSSNMSLIYRGARDDSIYLVAEPLSYTSTSTMWTITKTSVKRALESSLSRGDIFSILSSYSSYEIPENIKSEIESWEREYNRVRIMRGTVVTVDEALSPLFDTDEMKKYIILKLSPTSFLLESRSEEMWLKTLSDYGLGMLPLPVGPQLKERKKKEETLYTPLENIPLLPTKRKVEYDREEYETLMASLTNPYERLLLKEHLLFSKGESAEYEERDGLEYQEKREIIVEAFKNNEPVVLIDINDHYKLVNPRSINGDILTIGSRDLPISSIWKVKRAPGIIMKRRDLDL